MRSVKRRGDETGGGGGRRGGGGGGGGGGGRHGGNAGPKTKAHHFHVFLSLAIPHSLVYLPRPVRLACLRPSPANPQLLLQYPPSPPPSLPPSVPPTQRRLALVVGLKEIRPCLQQHPHGLGPAVDGRPPQGRGTPLVPPLQQGGGGRREGRWVGGGGGGKEAAEHGRASVVARDDEWRPAVVPARENGPPCRRDGGNGREEGGERG